MLKEKPASVVEVGLYGLLDAMYQKGDSIDLRAIADYSFISISEVEEIADLLVCRGCLKREDDGKYYKRY